MTKSVLASLIKSRFLIQSPYRLIHYVTSDCNCSCKACIRWHRLHHVQNDLTLDDIYSMLRNAREAGMIYYVAMGGEPLLRKDLPDILKYAKQLGFITAIVTNGFFLKERRAEILPYTDTLVVSIDAIDHVHDELRNVSGILTKAIDGIRSCKDTTTKIGILSTLSIPTVHRVDEMVQLAKELGVQITFHPIDLYKGYNDDLVPSQSEFREAFVRIRYWKKKGYDIGNSFLYLRYFSSRKPYRCHGPKTFINVDANGDIFSCIDVINKKWGTTKTTTFTKIFHSNEFKTFCRSIEQCNRCGVATVADASFAHTLNPFIIIEKAIETRFSFK
ncbi:MAG: radical SAM protein [Candidatus Thermoplasmatota archaeon]